MASVWLSWCSAWHVRLLLALLQFVLRVELLLWSILAGGLARWTGWTEQLWVHQGPVLSTLQDGHGVRLPEPGSSRDYMITDRNDRLCCTPTAGKT